MVLVPWLIFVAGVGVIGWRLLARRGGRGRGRERR
jgi:hypothetical protein